MNKEKEDKDEFVEPVENKDNWVLVKEGNFLYYNGKQFSKLERKYRYKRLTASNAGRAIGLTPAYYGTREELAEEILGIRKKVFDKDAIIRMTRGTKKEPEIRRLYERVTGYSTVETGLCVPTWNHRIAGSPDGMLVASKNTENEGKKIKNEDPDDINGNIEIKCPGTGEIYPELLEMLLSGKRGDYDDLYNSHLKRDHYCQMQLCLAITNRKFCDYIVWGYKSKRLYVERVWFNKKFWDEVMYPGILSFLELMDKIEEEYYS